MKIIVPIDFSKNALNALEYASRLAQDTNSTIKLIHVVSPTTYNATINGIMAEEIAGKRESAHEELQKLLKVFNAKYTRVVFDFEINQGETSEEIIKSSNDNEASMIIMGTHGATGLKKLFFGSNTASVIEQSACPVMAIPENYSFKKPKKIVFATNYHESDFMVLKQLASIAEVFTSEINVLHIIDDEAYTEDRLENIKQFVLLASSSILYSKISYKLFKSTDIPMGIESIIEMEGADIISLSTHKRNTIEKLINKSITKELSFHTKVPLLAFNMNEADDHNYFL